MSGQIATVLLFAVLSGVDNLQAACGLGVLPISCGRKWATGASFGICEAAMSLAGLDMGAFLRAYVFGAAGLAGGIALLVGGVAVIYLALNGRNLDNAANSLWIIFGVPLSLSLDNLVAGAALGASGYPVVLSVAIIGFTSATMSLLGLFLGTRLRRWMPRRAGIVGGVWLVLSAARSLVR
jgi:putative Mn2+ efflux pump MntP